MARTLRTVPFWAKTPYDGSDRYRAYHDRAARGQDGAVRSEIAQSAKAGKRDDWSTAPKGRANKRIATKQIRSFVKAETAREVENSDEFSIDEYREALKENESLARLSRGLQWAEEDVAISARDLSFYLAQLEELKKEISEIKGAKAP